jgi:DNA (cytosine-5)-methyltransferase 1
MEILQAREPEAPNLGDIREVNWRQVERVDWLTGGYPCQPFSVSGHRKGEDDERNVWPDVLTALRILRPRFVLLENVRGHLSKGFGTVIGDLARVGYLGSWVCVRASDIGACHGRERVFILGTDGWQTEAVKTLLSRAEQSRAEQRNPYVLLPTPTARDGRTTATSTRRAPSSAADRPLDETVCSVDWSDPSCIYLPAVRHWESVRGIPAPPPTVQGLNGQVINAAFSEWMMGLDPGHVTGVVPARTRALKASGNGVVPQQAAYAVPILLRQMLAFAESR